MLGIFRENKIFVYMQKQSYKAHNVRYGWGGGTCPLRMYVFFGRLP